MRCLFQTGKKLVKKLLLLFRHKRKHSVAFLKLKRAKDQENIFSH